MSDNRTLVKTNTPGLVKDTKSGAVLSTDDQQYKMIVARRKERAAIEKAADHQKKMEHEIVDLKKRIRLLEEKLGL